MSNITKDSQWLLETVQKELAPEDIKMWLLEMGRQSLMHMKQCDADPDNVIAADEALLFYEEGILFLLGLALKKGWLEEDKPDVLQ